MHPALPTELPPIPACPLNGSYVYNITMPMLELDPDFVPSGEHRWDLVFRLPNGRLLFKTQYFVYANGISFRKT
jgi:hypothetical protein